MSSFSDLSLLPSLISGLAAQKIHTPTPIQAQSIPVILEDSAVVGVSETGSGKTLAYVLPLLHKLKMAENNGSAVSNGGRPRGLVVVPGRELGVQVSRVFKSLTHTTRLRVRVAIGGSREKIARENVNGKFEILVATPGRLTQLLDSGALRLTDVRMAVFDEADAMLDAGFLPVVKRIVKECPKAVQLVMFSATFPVKLEAAVRAIFPLEPRLIRTRGSQNVVPTLTTDNRPVVKGLRFDVLKKVLAEDPNMGTILFVNTHKQGDRVAEWLEAEGYRFVAYRGQMDRNERKRNLKKFRDGQVNLLLTTDLGGRGLDIERVERVINVNLPEELDNYLHRVGRTARAGRKGTVVNLVTQRDHPLIEKLKKRAERRA